MVLEIEWPQTLFLPLAVNGTPSSAIASMPGTVEQCGRGYHNKVTIKSVKEDVLNDASEITEEEKKDLALREQMQSFDTDLEDFYGLLALNEFKFIATDEQVKQHWKIASMCCHPDKASPENRAQAELRYKAMQKGVETLLDKNMRKAYDSSLPFDDSVPGASEGTTEETFFKVYGPVFNANARFSISKKVPNLGDNDTPIKQVEKFYGFWLGFKSWREFSHPDEEKINDGTWREERRRIERANAKLRAAAKREETVRVRTMVEDAMKKDPRLIRERKAEEEAKAKKKKDKEDAKRRAEEEKERLEREKKQAEEKSKADAAEAKIQKQMLKNMTKTAKKRFKKFGKIVITAEVFLVNRTKPLDLEDIDFVVKNSELEDLQALVKQFQQDVEANTLEASYKMMCTQISKLKGENLEAIAAAQAEADAKKAAEENSKPQAPGEWTSIELKILKKAITKSSGGAKDWEKIAFDLSQVKADPNIKDRTTKEIMKKSKEPMDQWQTEGKKAKEPEPEPNQQAEAVEEKSEAKPKGGEAKPKGGKQGGKKGGDPKDKHPIPFGKPGNNVKIGLVGMPNVGKSSTFNLLGKLQVAAENYPFCTIDPSTAVVPVPDPRFSRLVNDWKPTSEVPAVLTVTDIAGLVRGASEGEGLGNDFLSHIQSVDAIYHVSRAFSDSEIEHVEGSVDPVRDFNIINGEMMKKDREWVNTHYDKLKKLTRNKCDKEQKKNLATMEKAMAHLDSGKEIRHGKWNVDDIRLLNTLNLLTSKPVVYLVNMSSNNFIKLKNKWFKDIKTWLKENAPMDKLIPYSVKFEQKILTMEDDERAKFLKTNKTASMVGKIINAGYKALRCINFFTTGTDEVRAWTVRDGIKAPAAAGTIHGDLEKTFITAEVCTYADFEEYGSEKECKAKGKLRSQGKAYVIQDGDIVYFNAGAGKKKTK